MSFKTPFKTLNHQGEIRKVGFEFEYAGLDLNTTASIIIGQFGGTITEKGRFSQTISNTKIGDIHLEIDVHALQNKNYQKELKKLGLDLAKLKIEEAAEDAIESIASLFVPYEIVLPPLPLDKLEIAEELRDLLHKNKVKGTSSSIAYAFAFQINIDLPELSAGVILNYLRSFLLLKDWIEQQVKTDFTRKYLTSFINDFPDVYKLKVLDENYAPSIEEFASDYKYHNNTRNRPLDLYPLLAYLNENYAKGIENEPLVKPRPALHYRFPNCLLDDPGWRVASEWNRWVEVDDLAWNKEKITKLSEEYIKLYHSAIFFKNKWSKVIEKEWNVR